MAFNNYILIPKFFKPSLHLYEYLEKCKTVKEPLEME